MTDTVANPAHSELEPREERRLCPRSRLTEIVYVNMQVENGGILLDISASGFGFQVASPIAAEREIKFRFSAEGIEDLEITANIAWLDSDRKRGGVKFDQLPEKVRSRINRWIGNPTTLNVVSPETKTRESAEFAGPTQHSKSGQIGRSLFSESNPYSLTQGRSQHGSGRSAVSDRPLEGLPNPLRTNSSFRPIFSSELKPETAHGRRLSGAISVPIFLLLLLAAGVFVFNNKHQVGTSITRLGERISGESAGQSTGSAPQTVARSSIASAPGPPEFANIEPQTGAPSAVSPSVSGPDSTDSASQIGNPVQPAQPVTRPSSGPATASPGSDHHQAKTPIAADRTQEPAASNFPSRSEHTAAPEKSHIHRSVDPARENDGHTELALARQYLRGGAVPKDRDMAAHLLWVAVGDGNPQAELELADLYLRSDGVPAKSCAQARILLNDSSNGGNLEASQQLAKLRDYGCR